MMNLSTVFQLNVSRSQNSLDCFFQLTWGERQSIHAELKYSAELSKLYKEWEESYHRAYESPSRGKAGDFFSYTPPSIDWKSKSETAKEEWLQKFRYWLGSQELREIREKIQSEIIRQTAEKNQRKRSDRGIDLLIACNCEDLVRLPWEKWELVPKDVPICLRISRTIINTEDKPESELQIPQRGQTRILVILADASDLNLLKDQQEVRSLENVAKVEYCEWESGQQKEDFRKKIVDAIADELGWDALIFAGHSDETQLTGGKLDLAPGVCLVLSEIEPALTKAKKLGLRAAIFNSCKGLSIAEFLIKLGLSQVVVMREPIHDTAAHLFLKHFCNNLAQHKDIHDALLIACQYFEAEKIAYPSAYLIPSLFRDPSSKAELFRIEPFGLKRVWRDWHPSWQEAIATATALLLSLMFPVQDLLLDSRIGIQAVYRHKTNQIQPDTSPPVLLVAVDQESINRAREQIQGFRIRPLDREYLANIVSRLAELKFKTIGVDYLLLTQEPREEKLIEAIKSAVSKQNTWFVFAVNKEKQWEMFPKIANQNWSLQGNITFFLGDMELPTDATCEQSCPFAYLLALSHRLNTTKSSTPQPNLQSKYPLQQQVSKHIKNIGVNERAIASLQQAHSPFGWRSIIDFSVPPKQVYEAVPAWKFLNSAFPNSEQQQRIKNQVAIVASVGYVDADAEDNFSVPLAVQYWCQSQDRREPLEKDCPEFFTGGKIHTYMVHHLLSQHRVTLLPDFWMIGLAVFLGKWTALGLLNDKRKQRQQWILVLAGATPVYGIIGLQIYIWASLSVPWFLPTLVFWTCVLFTLRRKPYA
jgi:CHASE2 domain